MYSPLLWQIAIQNFDSKHPANQKGEEGKWQGRISYGRDVCLENIHSINGESKEKISGCSEELTSYSYQYVVLIMLLLLQLFGLGFVCFYNYY